jgi:hypothetical protein
MLCGPIFDRVLESWREAWFLKQRLPAPVASQLDNVMAGGGAEGIAGKLGDVFGKKSA